MKREEDYLTLTVACANTLCKVCTVNYQVFSFYINNYRKTIWYVLQPGTKNIPCIIIIYSVLTQY